MSGCRMRMDVNFLASDEEIKLLKKEAANYLKDLKSVMQKSRVRAKAFLGGSFAKGTMTEGKNEIDFFIRFDNEKDIVKHLTAIRKEMEKRGYKTKTLHGSRDYFVAFKNKIEFENIPVLKIKSHKEATNVTDLSYFH